MLKLSFPSRIILMILVCCYSALTFAENDPSINEVYLAAKAGKFKKANDMMSIVLQNHPNSAKAHFIEAELLAKQGLNSNASVELSKAEQLEPALTFVTPEAMQNLKSFLANNKETASRYMNYGAY